MKQSFIQTLEDEYKKNKNISEIYEYFYKLGYSNKKINTGLSDLRRYRGLKIEYKQNKKHNLFKPQEEIILFDIETAPLKAWVWSKWNNDIHKEQLIQDWFVISWALKYLNSDVVESLILYPEEVRKEDDSRIIKEIHAKLKNAKVVIAHNARRFDIKRLNTRFIYHNLQPIDYKVVDTLDEAKKNFNFTSNKLDDLATFFNIENKNTTDFSLWKRCMEGNEDALEEMKKYNVQDVVVLEKIYLKLRPYMKNHPNVSNMLDIQGCPSCGSNNIERDGVYYTNTSKYPKYKCNDCGSLSRSRANQNSKDKMKNLLVSI